MNMCMKKWLSLKRQADNIGLSHMDTSTQSNDGAIEEEKMSQILAISYFTYFTVKCLQFLIKKKIFLLEKYRFCILSYLDITGFIFTLPFSVKTCLEHYRKGYKKCVDKIFSIAICECQFKINIEF